jgi:hypothetical protein
MSARTKHVLLYIAFVGIPVLSLVAVLHAGRDLGAPPSIGGRWKVNCGAQLAAAIACSPVQDEDPITLRIGQSGTHLRMELHDKGNTLLDGQLEGDSVTAQANPPHGQPAPLLVHAVIDPGSQPKTLVGTVDVTRCPSQVQFRAVREATTGGML